jgi:hypothetical protein
MLESIWSSPDIVRIGRWSRIPDAFFHMNIKQSPICNRKNGKEAEKRETVRYFYFMTCYWLTVNCIDNYPL